VKKSILLYLLPLGLFGQTAPMLRAHVEFLASDDMHGRPCPSQYCDLTADYVLAHLRGAGLETQVQTSEAVFEIKRGDVVVRPTGVELPKENMVMNLPAAIDGEGKLTTRFGGVVIEKNAELDPIYAATGQVRVTNIPAGQRNIIGVLKGRDPVLRNTYVLVTAHYDHIGEKKDATGDTIYNGANDNASSVSALIEIARAMAAAPVKPRRSVVFMAYFGEERGLVGSRYYAAHPVFPIEKTYAQVNLEQLGRTDDVEGPRLKAATLTGWDRSEVGTILAAAAKPLGIRIYKHEKYSEEFFERSDNEALVKLGVPAHTISVAYGFPDYHGLGDEAGKLDYANMTAVSRAVRAGISALANRTLKLTLREGSPAVSAPKSGSSPASPKPKQSKPSRKPQPR
jgi:hypothetical protein